ncbi:MAG: glycosyltransferase [Spirochaetia bacterium]|nr:glycosyltransferase [Spirochaetia bacterium]
MEQKKCWSLFIRHTDREKYEPEVLSLLPVQLVGKAIQQTGVPVASAEMNSSVPTPRSFWAVYQWIRRRKPAVVQTWMYHADVIGGVAARLAGVPVVWGIHQSNLDPAVNTRNTMVSAKLGRLLSSKLPEKIVCCSFASERTHTAFGYDSAKMQVIHNGFETPAVSLNSMNVAGETLREELGIGHEEFVIGLVARFNPQKDHAAFLEAARRLHRTHQERDIRFVLCGLHVEWQNPEFAALIPEGQHSNFGKSLHLLGRRSDMDRVYAAMDLLSTSSVGEGLPLVVGEAMARGVPCVVTDVGDSAYVVGETGWVVPPADPAALAARWEVCAEMGRRQLKGYGEMARRRIETELHIDTAVQKYHDLYTQIYERRYS